MRPLLDASHSLRQVLAKDHPAARRLDARQSVALVLAGSLSPLTARQVAAATSFDTVWLDPRRLVGSDRAALDECARDLASRLAPGRHVLAALLAAVLDATPLTRVGVAGGDTSSHAVQALDAWGLSYQASLAPGVALCRLHSDRASLDGMELMLKGGQMGGDHLFETLVA